MENKFFKVEGQKFIAGKTGKWPVPIKPYARLLIEGIMLIYEIQGTNTNTESMRYRFAGFKFYATFN